MKRMAALAGALLIALLGGPSGAVTTQDATAPATWVAGPETQAPCEVRDVETVIEDGPVTGHRGLPISCTDDLGDPRLSGSSVKHYNDDRYEGAGCVCWGTQELTGPDGRGSARSTGR